MLQHSSPLSPGVDVSGTTRNSINSLISRKKGTKSTHSTSFFCFRGPRNCFTVVIAWHRIKWKFIVWSLHLCRSSVNSFWNSIIFHNYKKKQKYSKDLEFSYLKNQTKLDYSKLKESDERDGLEKNKQTMKLNWIVFKHKRLAARDLIQIFSPPAVWHIKQKAALTLFIFLTSDPKNMQGPLNIGFYPLIELFYSVVPFERTALFSLKWF